MCVYSIIAIAFVVAVLVGIYLAVNTHIFEPKNDCPYMGSSVVTETMFLDWVWRRRKEFIPTKEWENGFYLPTPYILGGYMWIWITDDGIGLSISPSLHISDLGRCIPKVSYGCNRAYNSHSSKKQWVQLVEWFEANHDIKINKRIEEDGEPC